MTEDGKKILEQIKADSAMEAYCLTIRRDATPGLLDSKFGGLAYWDSSLPYPTDPRGVPMQLLAQINFGQFQAEAPLPRRGLLQFFIGWDDVSGMSFDDQTAQTGFRVLYHEIVDPTVTAEEVAAKRPPKPADGEDWFPVARNCRIILSAPKN